MDRGLVLTILALCIINVVSQGGPNNTMNGSTVSPQVNTTTLPTTCRCPDTTTSTPTSQPQPPPPLPVLIAQWMKPCEWNIHITYFNTSTYLPACLSKSIKVHFRRWSCEQIGCGGNQIWKTYSAQRRCYMVSDSGEVTQGNLGVGTFQCDGTNGELVGYKVVISLLCVLVLVVLIVRFGQPSLKALRKKMSDRRQSRWIGPTQSQSVSYHRGKAGIQLNDKTDKRTSFPGLERLTVNNSREPSSNRNSDYDSYNL